MLWECYFLMFSEPSETIKYLDECPTKMFQKKHSINNV